MTCVPHIRLRVFDRVFLRIVAGYRLGTNKHLLNRLPKTESQLLFAEKQRPLSTHKVKLKNRVVFYPLCVGISDEFTKQTEAEYEDATGDKNST